MIELEVKLMPVESPNCTLIYPCELSEMAQYFTGMPIEDGTGIIGYIQPDTVTVKDGWFYGKVRFFDGLESKNYEWENACINVRKNKDSETYTFTSFVSTLLKLKEEV